MSRRSAGLDLHLFDITIPALALVLPGLLYVVLIVPRIVGAREAVDPTRASGKQFIAELVLETGHPLVGIHSVTGLFPGLRHVTVRLVERDGHTILPPFEDLAFQPGDRVVFAGVRRELAELGII